MQTQQTGSTVNYFKEGVVLGKTGKDYIVFPLDVPTAEEAQRYVRLLKDCVGMFKIGLELFISQGPSIVRMVKDNSDAGIFLDLKLHDISATVFRAMTRVADLGVDLVTVHCSSRVMLEKAVEGGQGRTGVLGVTLLTDNDREMVRQAGFRDELVQDTAGLVSLRAQMAADAGCTGIVCSGREVEEVKQKFGRDFLGVTPGIRPKWSLLENDDQKRVTTPEQAIAKGSDLLVVGRPIRDAAHPDQAAQMLIDEIDAVLK